MKKVNTLLKNKNVKPENIISFPFDKLIDFPWGEKGFCYFVDAENGNDANSGLTLKHAKKTINAALNSLPHDLYGHEARIFIHPGTYVNETEHSVINILSNNGKITFNWLGTWANPGDPDFVSNGYSNWLYEKLGGAVVRSNDQIVIHAKHVTSGEGTCVSAGWSCDFTIHVWFASQNFAKSWLDPHAQYAFRWKFIQDNDCAPTIECMISSSRMKEFWLENPIEIDFTNAIHRAIWINSPSAHITPVHAYSTSLSPICTKTGYWWGVINFGPNCTSDAMLEDFWWPANAFHPDYPKPSPAWKFEGHRQILGVMNGCKAVIHFNNDVQYLQGFLPDANPPQIFLSDLAECSLVYNSNVATLVDTSTSVHKVTDVSTGVTNNYIGAGLKTVANHFQFPLQTSAQSDSNLQNKDVVFYLDESNNKLKVKLKYSNGTIKTGEISLL